MSEGSPALRDAELPPKPKIRHAAGARSFGNYGARKVWSDLNRAGTPVARCTMQRLRCADGLDGRVRAAAGAPRSPPIRVPAPRTWSTGEFQASRPNALWVADITWRRGRGAATSRSSPTCSRPHRRLARSEP